jgi:hypothetical protein
MLVRGDKVPAQDTGCRFCWSDDLADQLQLTVQISHVNTGSEIVNIPTNLVVQRLIVARSYEDLMREKYISNVSWTTFEGNFENGQTALNVTPLSKQTLALIRRFAPLIPKDANLRELSLRARFVLVLGTPEIDLHTTLPRAFLRSIRTQDSALKLDVQQEGAKCVK